MEWILIRYGEIGLKSDWVRKEFENKLMDNIRTAFNEKDIEGTVKRGYGRIFVRTDDMKKAKEVLERTFGIVSFSPCEKIETGLGKVVERMGEISEDFIQKNNTFAVRARRTGNHEFSSKDIEERVGSKVIEKTGADVDLDDPDKTIYCEIRQSDAYIFMEKIDGPGGLPVGTQGRVVSLFKGDCRSFLSAWLLMKRGCSVVLLHGDPDPYANIDMDEVYSQLEEWSHGSDFKFLAFDHGEKLFRIQESEYEKMTCVLCRRFLLKLASELAEEEDAKAIVSGESGDGNFRVFGVEDEATNLPVLRPLVGLDRGDIRSKCKDIADEGLLEESSCMAKSETPEISLDTVKEAEKDLNFNGMVKETLEGLEDNL